MVEFLQSTLFAIACVAVPLCLLFWLWAIDRAIHGRPLVDWSLRRPVPWTILDLLVLVILTVILTTVAQLLVASYHNLSIQKAHLANAELTPAEQVSLVTAFSIASFQVWVLSLLWMSWHAGAAPRDLGWRADRWTADLQLGLVAFIMLVVPMLGIHYLALKVFPTEDGHPFIQIVLENPRPQYLVPIIVAAVVVAPVVEEYMFRVFLQGWLERWTFPASRTATEDAPAPPTAMVADLVDDDVVDAEIARRVTEGQVFETDPRTDATAGMPADTCPTETNSPVPRTRWWPIAVSGLLFGLAHFGQGPAPIPLVFLGLGLGYLYQRTHRVLPCIVVHFLVNATAVVQLAVYIAERQPAVP